MGFRVGKLENLGLEGSRGIRRLVKGSNNMCCKMLGLVVYLVIQEASVGGLIRGSPTCRVFGCNQCAFQQDFSSG